MFRKGKITHRVDPYIDAERDKIVRDLTLAGCVDTVHNATRPAMPNSLQNATGDQLRTDGAVSVIQLKNCDAPVYDNAENDSTLPTLIARPASKLTRYFRTQVLTLRDMWRENAVYEAVDLSRMAIRSMRRNNQVARQVSAPLPQTTLNQTAAAGPHSNIILR
jgi:hypothetical protein